MTKAGYMFAVLLAGALLSGAGALTGEKADQLARHRNLGKAFYENPTTHDEAVAEFARALALAPDSARERVNYGLALLRGAKVDQGIAELEKAQKQDPSIPHTWFNLGIEYKRRGDSERAIAQLEGMLKLVPNEAITHYNLGVLYKMSGRAEDALKQFELAAQDDPNLAGARFQLFTAYKAAGRPEADDLWKTFQELKKRQAKAATPEDLEWSYYSEVLDPVEAHAPPPPPPDAVFERKQLPGKVDASGAALATMAGDGGRPTLLAWSSEGILLFRDGTSPVEKTGLEDVKGVLSVVPGDFNNDGLPDLCVITAAGAQLFVNRAGVFEKAGQPAMPGEFSTAAWLDFDHDGDPDLFLIGPSQALWRNNGEAGFSNETGSFPFVAGDARGATIFQQMSESDELDLVVTYTDRNGVVYRDRLGGHYEAVSSDAIPPALSVTAEDINNDGWLDLVVRRPSGLAVVLNRKGKLDSASPIPGQGPLVLSDVARRGVRDVVADGIYWNDGDGRFTRAKADLPKAVALASGDFDGDGREDLAVVEASGHLAFLKNSTAAAGLSLRVALDGVRNPKLAPGAIVEVKAGGSYQKRLYQGAALVFGLGSYPEADAVRITWPNGLIQNEARQRAGGSYTYKEAQRLSGSCPMIFAWNGRDFEFITDVLGVAPLGASSGDGNYFPTNHREDVRIPASSLIARDGFYEVRVTEELREVSYIDQIRLTAVDHPASSEVLTNDKFKSPPFPDFRLFHVTRRVHPVSVRDDAGRNVRDLVLRRDATYPDGFRRTLSGVAAMHTLDLDFGAAAPSNRAILVLSGWVDWADGSTFRAVSQESAQGFVLPYLQVKDPRGRWKTVVEDMGIPAGKPKTIVVDLAGKFLSSSREVRIVTNLCVYWDEIYLSEDSERSPARLTEAPLETAALQFRGFSRPVVDPLRRQPERFDYGALMLASNWNPTAGLYTRYGDVASLLNRVDDKFVIMGSGDEMRLRFDARRLPPLPRGWERDFLLHVDGWAKDADANTAFAKSVEPLPFHAMSSYPYPRGEHFPNDDEHRDYFRTYNTRPALRLLRPLHPQRAGLIAHNSN